MLLALIVLLFFSKECPFEMCILCDNVGDTIVVVSILFRQIQSFLCYSACFFLLLIRCLRRLISHYLWNFLWFSFWRKELILTTKFKTTSTSIRFRNQVEDQTQPKSESCRKEFKVRKSSKIIETFFLFSFNSVNWINILHVVLGVNLKNIFKV